MKKRLLFVIESLNLGGAEKSLVTLLNRLDYEKYEVDLQLFTRGGKFEELLPEEVNILPQLPYFGYCCIAYNDIFRKLKAPFLLYSQVSYSIKLRLKKYNNIEKSVNLWKTCRRFFEISNKQYDVAIAYAQGTPTFYVNEKVNAIKKIAYINISYFPKEKYKTYIENQLGQFDFINCVSDSVYNQCISYFKLETNKYVIIEDLIDTEFNVKMANLTKLGTDVELQNDELFLLSVGRLVNQKGFDMAVEACKILINRELKFKWFVIGEGNQRQLLEDKIRKNKLEDIFILLGAKSNPYPYFKACDIYIQPSRFEGFGITIAEAKMFNKPIVATNFDAVRLQITNNINGLIVDLTPESIAYGIQKMINDNGYRNNIIENLKQEDVNNYEELDKFYEIIEESK